MRQGGWSWGPDRQKLVDFASSALPRLISEALSGILPAEGDNHVSKLRVHLKGNKATIAAIDSSNPAQLKSALHDSARRQLVAQLGAELPLPAEPDARDQTSADEASPMPAEPADAVALVERWRSDGSLPQRLELFTTTALAGWLDLWLKGTGSQGERNPVDAAALRRAARSLLRIIPRYGDDTAGVLRRRLHLVAELRFHTRGSMNADDVEETLDLLLPEPGKPRALDDEQNTIERTHVPGALEAGHESESKSDTSNRYEGAERADPDPPTVTTGVDTHVASALPFLLLGILQRTGYLECLSATLESRQASELAPVFAAALALILLPEKSRGVLLDNDERVIVETFSSLASLPAPQAFDDYDWRVGDAMSAADANLHAELVRGHTPGTPLFVERFARGWMIFDTEGMFPVAYAYDVERLDACLRAFNSNALLLSTAAIDNAISGYLAEARQLFATDSLPGREDHWRTIDGARGLWTGRDRPISCAEIARFQASAEAAEQFTSSCIASPLAQQLRPDSPLFTSTALAAGVGLADIALTLWADREFAHPSLARNRMQDLGARVRIDAEQIRVSLAVGRRYLDLRDNGFLADVDGIPWLSNRRLIFTGI